MKKNLSTFLFLILSITSSIYADGDSFKGGAFVGYREGFPGPDSFPLLDEYVLYGNHTATWTQSSDLMLPLNIGTNSGAIGTWEIRGKYIYLTMINSEAKPIEFEGIHDLALSNWVRSTQKFKIIDEKTLRVIHRVILSIPLTQDPVTAPGEVVLDSSTRFLLNKVKVIKKDLGPCEALN